jgi:ribosomal protein S18 acetylase RimI-like enzyme
MHVTPYLSHHRDSVLDLSIRAWTPVFAGMRDHVPGFVYDNFYPQGWEARQRADLAAVLDGEPEHCAVAVAHDSVVGWVCTRLHPEDTMGEVYVLAVDPAWQRRGVGTALLEHACAQARRAGMDMVMVETGGDAGHAPARAQYESAGFTRWPVARYFKEL